MSDFSTAFGQNGERRLPDGTEREQGFLCGPADRTLFNGLFHRIESELGDLISYAGLVGSDGDLTQVRKAILALIDAATGGGDTSAYLLLSQARSRLPFFPDVQTVSGHFGVISPATGQARIPAGTTFLYRGIDPIVTELQDFATDPSKIYHLRWNPVDEFVLKDLSSLVYNPSGLNEANEVFDTTFDDMLVARITTNSSNSLTITNLKNKDRLFEHAAVDGVVTTPSSNTSRATFDHDLNWARTPKTRGFTIAKMDYDQTVAAPTGQGDVDMRLFTTYPTYSGVIPATRYKIKFDYGFDFMVAMSIALNAEA